MKTQANLNALAANDNIGKARIFEPPDSALLIKVESNVSHVGLHLGERHDEFVTSVVLDLFRDVAVRTEFDEVVCLDGHEIREEVAPG